ncbi:MAG: hypothetical protein ACLQQ4_03070 [Bacteroidia bacterium]
MKKLKTIDRILCAIILLPGIVLMHGCSGNSEKNAANETSATFDTIADKGVGPISIFTL